MTVYPNSTAAVTSHVGRQVSSGLLSFEQVSHFLLAHGPNVVYAIIIFIIGRYIAKFCKKLISQMMRHADYDHTVNTFVSQIIYYGLLALVILSAVNKLGIPTNSFIAVFGAFGLAVGLAMQNNLANFASGILLLIFKPFKAGDWVSLPATEGTIKGIQLMNTVLITKDNKTVFIPNSQITSSQVTNSSYMEERYIPLLLDISYDTDHHQVIRLLKEVFRNDARILNADTAEIGIREFADNAVRIAAYPLVKNSHFIAVRYDLLSAIKDAFDAHHIVIPYPQRVVYMKAEATAEKK